MSKFDYFPRIDAEPDYDAEMRLPKGKTCDDCAHARRCFEVLGCSKPGRTSCDFWPRRYVEAPLSAPAEGTQDGGEKRSDG